MTDNQLGESSTPWAAPCASGRMPARTCTGRPGRSRPAGSPTPRTGSGRTPEWARHLYGGLVAFFGGAARDGHAVLVRQL
ncbi:hypothetical protein [Streptomyces sp. NPDC090445]|uniref:hypothetical protein n=1 Tax=Streptomyces sp. NPDC090445 TaxID=3365963 RepID=UPI0037F4B9F7